MDALQISEQYVELIAAGETDRANQLLIDSIEVFSDEDKGKILLAMAAGSAPQDLRSWIQDTQGASVAVIEVVERAEKDLVEGGVNTKH